MEIDSRDKKKTESLLNRFLSYKKIGPFLSGLGVFVKDYTTNSCVPNSFWKELGYGSDEMRGNSWKTYLHPDDYEKIHDIDRSLYSGAADTWEGSYRIRAKDGTYHHINHRCLILERGSNAVPSLYVGSDIDITEYMTMMEQLRAEGEIQERLFLRSEEIRTAGAILSSELDPASAADRILCQARNIIPFDAASVRALDDAGFEPIASLGFKADALHANLHQAVEFEYFAHQRSPIVFTPSEGPFRSALIVPLLKRDTLVGFLDFYSNFEDAYGPNEEAAAILLAEQAGVVFSNALKYRNTEREASIDWLTSLPTRRAFMSRASCLCTDLPKGGPLAVLIIDIDHFKLVNDTYGHPVGDKALVAIADTIRDTVRSEDLYCRYGGEEFVVLLPHADARIAMAAAERIRVHIQQIAIPTYPDLHLTVSIGISASENKDFRDLISGADEALYLAKQTGRNRCELR
ncbi:hypothetical protein MASR2M78_07570 [Treponema sp.]